jgi:hypothetical protein
LFGPCVALPFLRMTAQAVPQQQHACDFHRPGCEDMEIQTARLVRRVRAVSPGIHHLIDLDEDEKC